MTKIFGISALISNLLDAGVRRSLTEPMVEDDTAGATLRLDRDLKHFLDCQAAQLGVSRSAMITMILRGTMEQSQAEATGVNLADETSRMLQRFHLLMSIHDLDSISVVELLTPFGITLDDLRSLDKLVTKINRPLIDFLTARFLVDVNWLLGRADYPGIFTLDWDRKPAAFCQAAVDYRKRGSDVEIIFVRAKDANFEDAFKYDNLYPDDSRVNTELFVPIIRVTDKLASNRPLTIFRVGDSIPWNHARTRIEAKAVILWATRARRRLGIGYHSVELDKQQLLAMLHRKIMPVQALKHPFYSGWFVDDYVDGVSEAEDRKRVDDLYKDRLAVHFDEMDWVIPDEWEPAMVLRARKKNQ